MAAFGPSLPAFSPVPGPPPAPPVPSSLPTLEVRTLKGHKGPLQVVAFNSDGRYLFTGGQDRNILLWNPYRAAPEGETTGGYILQEYNAHGYEVMDVAVAADNTRFASVGGDRCAYLWDTGSGAVVRKYFGHEQRLNSASFNGDGTVLCTGSNDKTIKCWDIKSASRAPIQTLAGFKDNVTRVVCLDDSIIGVSLDGTIRSFDLRAGKCIVDTIGQPLTSMAVSNDRNCYLVASSGSPANLALIDRPAGSLLCRYEGHINAAYRLVPTLTSSDSHVICGSETGEVYFWDLVEASVSARLEAHTRAVACVAHHPSPLVHVMATASFDGTAKLYAGADQELSMLTIRQSDDD